MAPFLFLTLDFATVTEYSVGMNKGSLTPRKTIKINRDFRYAYYDDRTAVQMRGLILFWKWTDVLWWKRTEDSTAVTVPTT